MFTGIVTAVGRVRRLERAGAVWRLEVDTLALEREDARVGESVAVQGVCLTAVAWDEAGFRADLAPETLRCTTLGRLRPGSPVNLERALRPADRLGGHLVTGHVDAVAKVDALERDARGIGGEAARLRVRLPPALARYVAPKGSVCVDGVSLTVQRVRGEAFEAQLVPHTLAVTTLGRLRPGDACNVEVDLVARYVERLLAWRAEEGDG